MSEKSKNVVFELVEKLHFGQLLDSLRSLEV